MAEKPIQLDVVLNTALGKVDKDIDKIKNAGGFSGEQGTKLLNKTNGLLSQLKEVNLSNLKPGPEFTNFLNQLLKLRGYLDSAANGLSNFSAEYTKALDDVKKQAEEATKAQDKLAEATRKQREAVENSKPSLQNKLKEGYKYRNTETGGYPRSPEAIAKALNSGNLEVFNPQSTKLHDAALNSHLQSAGIFDVARSTKEAEEANRNLEDANKELERLNNILENTDPGSDVNPVTKEINQESAHTRGVVSTLKELSTAEDTKAIQDTNAEFEKLTANLNKQTSALGQAFKQFTFYAIALRGAKRALRDAINTVKELDRALTEQAMVTGLSRKQTYGLLSSYQDMSARLGATTKEVSSTMTEFLRQGRSIAEATKLTEAAISAAKVAGISAADSINYLTTAVNGFQLSASEAMKVSDKFAAVAATAAASYEEVAIALSKVAAQANLAGMSIDYTTALLTKGIETTREAPETIGTALKTIIARMRELGDYGKTLEGDMDLNNVESQLAYIGIQLREDNGELRSTEDVLNDLGAKWDTLNANQQAAVAKALAGTRQQSRLIAMMQDYERVLELQQVAQRSAGATMAQMSTYLEGVDAALNRVSVAWEKIVSSVVNNDFVINLVNTFSQVLDLIGTVFEKTEMIIPVIGLLILKGTEYLGLKLKEQDIARQTAELNRKIELEKLKTDVKIQQVYVQQLRDRAKQRKAEIDAEHKQTRQKIDDMEAVGALKKEEADAARKIADSSAEYAMKAADEEAKLTENQIDLEQDKLKVMNQVLADREAENDQILTLQTSWSGYASVLTTVGKKIKDVCLAVPKMIAAFKAAKASADGSKGSLRAASAAYIPVIGWAISLILEGAAIIGIIANAVKGLAKWIGGKTEKDKANEINELSASIYKLNQQITKLNSGIDAFDELDKKILKTKKDLDEMNKSLDTSAEALDDDAKKIYDTLTTTSQKRALLLSELAKAQDKINKERNEQRSKILNNKNSVINNTSTEWLQARDSMYALNNAQLYAYIDQMDDLAEGTEQFVQTLLEGVPAAKAYEILQNPERIKEYINEVQNGIEVFNDESKSLRERVAAYNQLRDSITDPEMRDALMEVYSEWETFSTAMSGASLDFIDSIGANIDSINALGKAVQSLGYDTEESTDKLDQLFSLLESGAQLSGAISDIFGVSIGSEDYNKILDAYDKAFGTTILNMGQNVERLQNTIDSFYDKAAEWGNMSESDKSTFLAENEELFKGADGKRLLAAFESANYAEIAEAMRTNEALSKQREQLLNSVNTQLSIELAKAEKEQNQAYIKELQQYKKELEDEEKFYLASLQRRYDQQQKQIDAYKDMLQQQTDALVDALNKRKEAYQKYFDDINKKEEQQEYEDQANLLIENISKLSSSQNADAVAKTYDLEKQLEELNKERLKELRQQAQEAVIQNIEDEVTQINDNLTKLLNNEQALLEAILNDSKNPADLMASLMSSQIAQGNTTELGMQSYLKEMSGIFGSLMPGVDWNNVDVQRNGDSLILNLAGENVVLTDTDKKTIYDAIREALVQIGKI